MSQRKILVLHQGFHPTLLRHHLMELAYSNLSKLELEAIRSLAEDRSTVIKKVDKGSRVVIWDRLDYLMEAEKQLKDSKAFQEVTFRKNILTNLVKKKQHCLRTYDEMVQFWKENSQVFFL